MGSSTNTRAWSTRAPFAAGAEVAPGDVLGGKYQVERVLGAGGMGVVVAARHLHLDERVAIKFLEQALQSPEALARFEQEARAAVRIKSQHVARVIDVGRLDNGAPYIVMEYLEGGDLSAWLEQRGAMPVEQAVEFVIQACDALAEAHSLGIVHRDLKPPNLFCTRGADNLFSIKVLDFGISKILWDTGPIQRDRAMTRTQTLIGTPLYMSPEQMQSSKTLDARTDIWSLGIILFELLTGRPPFEADELPSLVLKIVAAAAPSLRAARPDVSPALESAVLRCLEKDPARRYLNVGELVEALAPFAPLRTRSLVDRILRIVEASGLASTALDHATPSDPRPSLPLSPPPSTPVQAPSIAPWGAATGAPPSTSPSKLVTALLVAAALAVILSVGLAALWQGSSHAAASGAPSAATQRAPSPPPSASAFVAPSATAAPPPEASASIPTLAASSLPIAKPRTIPAPRTAPAPTPKVPSYDHM